MPACKRLISHAWLPREVISLIQTIFTSEYEVKMILGLRGDDAQTFIDAIHKVLFCIPSFQGPNLITLLSSAPSLLNFQLAFPGSGSPRPLTAPPREVSACAALDMWSPGFTSEITSNTHLL